jgi:adenylosuccinate lyase
MLFSPLDTRYSKDLPASLSEEALLEAQIEIEKKYLLALMQEGLCPRIDETELDKLFAGVTFAEIEEIETTTQHATRALVETLALRLKKGGHPKAASWVHVGITSFDTVDTATRLRLRKFFEVDMLVAIDELDNELKKWARMHSATPQVGRTHGQWAVPTYFGIQFAEAAERIRELKIRIELDVNSLRGQTSGAIGGYHALGLLVKDPLKFESHFLRSLKLQPHMGSTQILPPEDIVGLAQHTYSLSSVVAKMATDLRHLARSEIAEIAEGLAPGQVGSSTMPQKRNPWNLEHVCSLFKVLGSRLNLMQSDMISEHQRDLTNSASGRFYTETFAIAYLMIKRLTKVLKRMECYPAKMAEHLNQAGSSIYAEALYVLATKHGVEEAHSKVRECARESERTGTPLIEVAVQQGLLPKDMTLKSIQVEVLKGPQSKMETFISEWRNL